MTVFERDPSPDSLPATVDWPGHRPRGSFGRGTSRWAACGVVTGQEAGGVYQAALNNPGARWLVSGTKGILTVNPMPGNKVCCAPG